MRASRSSARGAAAPEPAPASRAAPLAARPLAIEARPGGVLAARFLAMGCPCEVLVATSDATQARALALRAAHEAWRIEAKFSRYRADSVLAAIHAGAGTPVAIDAETERLLDYAAHCHALSQGRFDITTGVLRRAWTFDGSAGVPDAARVEALRAHIGFERLRRTPGFLCLPAGMEIDLGGLAKEYAVDQALALVLEDAAPDALPPVLVNFGGDLRASRAPGSAAWQVGIEGLQGAGAPWQVLELTRGALATSGDTHRFVRQGERRLGHILDPRSGRPVQGAPQAVTVAAPTCIEAGTLSTLAMLQGRDAESFLDELGARYWILR